MNDQEKAREELIESARLAHNQSSYGLDEDPISRAVDRVLSADPRVIAEAMGGELRVEPEQVFFGPTIVPERTVIVLPPRKVES